METQEEFEQRKSDDIEKTAIVNELRGLLDKQDTVLSKTAALRKPLKGPAEDLSSLWKPKRNKYDDFDVNINLLEEPYTQREKSPPSQSNDNKNDSDEDSMDMDIFNLHKCKKSGEPIRPGDVIEYCNPMFVKGSAQGERSTMVLSVDPSNYDEHGHYSLRLSNMEVIPDTTEVRRVKIMTYRRRNVKDDNRIKRKRNSNGKSHASKELGVELDPELGQIDHLGVSRLIHDFTLVKWDQPPRLFELTQMGTEQMRMETIMKKNHEIMEKNAKKDGFAPMDMVYGGRAKRKGNGNGNGNRGEHLQLSGSVSEIDESDFDSGSESDDSLNQIVKRNKLKDEERKKLLSSISSSSISRFLTSNSKSDIYSGFDSHSYISNSVNNKHSGKGCRKAEIIDLTGYDS